MNETRTKAKAEGCSDGEGNWGIRNTLLNSSWDKMEQRMVVREEVKDLNMFAGLLS